MPFKKGNKLYLKNGFKKGHKCFVPREFYERRSKELKGKLPKNFKLFLDKGHSKETAHKISISTIKRYKSQEERDKTGLSRIKSYNIRGRKSPLNKLIRGNIKFVEWRKGIFERDNYTCVRCGEKNGYGKTICLHPHHKKHLSLILEENNIKTLNQAINCNEVWDINNGETLCYNCHIKMHIHTKLTVK